MRIAFLFFVMAGIGCFTPAERLPGNIEIENALEKRITDDQARAIVLGPYDEEIERIRQADQMSAESLQAFSRAREESASRLAEFLSLRRPEDALWTYRTFATADLRGGTSGLALIRRGRTAAHMPLFKYD